MFCSKQSRRETFFFSTIFVPRETKAEEFNTFLSFLDIPELEYGEDKQLFKMKSLLTGGGCFSAEASEEPNRIQDWPEWKGPWVSMVP